MGENKILLQLTRGVQQGPRELKETHMLKVSHHLDHLKTSLPPTKQEKLEPVWQSSMYLFSSKNELLDSSHTVTVISAEFKVC